MKNPVFPRALVLIAIVLIAFNSRGESRIPEQSFQERPYGVSGFWEKSLEQGYRPLTTRTQDQAIEPPGWIFKSLLSKQRVKFFLGERVQVTHKAWEQNIKTNGYLQEITDENLILLGEDGQTLKIRKAAIQKIKRCKGNEKARTTAGMLLLGSGILVGILTAIFLMIVSVVLLPFALLGADTSDTESESVAPGKILMILLIIGGILVLAFSGSKSVARPFSVEWSVERVGMFQDDASKTPEASENDEVPSDMPRA